MEGEHRLKERVELSLDNRQIFYLFVASAAVVSVVFALGVVVGKRLVAVESPAARPTDPLALLDQLGQIGKGATDEELTFHEALTAPKPAKPAVAAPAADTPPPDRPVAPAPPSAEPATPPAAVAPAVVAAAPRPALPAAPPKPVASKPVASKPVASKPVASKPVASKPVASKPVASNPVAAAKPEDGAANAGYTLQLSSFQDRAEAERFMQRLRASGMKPHIIPAQIPERGTWFRVRVGSFRSWDEAVAAKAKFERTQQSIAYVTRSGS